MTKIYFVRHAEPVHNFADDKLRPLTKEGIADCKNVAKILSDIELDFCICSPYKRSIDTIEECAKLNNLEINIDCRFREREVGTGNSREMTIKRWTDFNFCEESGENLDSVQRRNIEGVQELLKTHRNENILFGTHGTALSTILNFYDNIFGFEDFWRIIAFTPYIICLEFEEKKLISKKELLIIEKENKYNV